MYRNFGLLEASMVSKQFGRLMKAVVVSSTDVKCQNCEQNFGDSASLLVHKQRNNCSKPFDRRIEDSDSDFHWTTDENEIVIVQPAARESQVTWKKEPTQTKPPLTHSCEFCMKSFAYPVQLAKHVQVKHSVTRELFSCDLCNFQCAHRHLILSHMKNRHLPRKERRICEVCAKEFVSRATLRHHMLIHLPEKTYKCDKCGQAFAQAAGLKSHFIFKHDTKIYKCEYCQREFKSYPARYYHIKVEHMGCINKNLFECPECKMQYKTKKYFKNHVCEFKKENPKPVSTANKKYVCGVCDYKTTAQSFLMWHMVKHTGDKPYECQDCGKKIAWQVNYTKHLKLCKERKRKEAILNN